MAAIELNGAPVGRAANAHRPHAFDITDLLKKENNNLGITIFSATRYAAAQQADYPYPVPATQVGRLWAVAAGSAAPC